MIRFGKLLACVGLVAFSFTNKAAADGPWDAYAGFSNTQGPVWYYQQRPAGSPTPVTNMTWNTPASVYVTTDVGNTGWQGDYTGISTGHPGNSIDIIRKWVAPSGGTVNIIGRVFKVDTSGGAGIIASIEKQGSVLWSKTIAYDDAVGYSTDSLGAVSVTSGQSICFIVDDNNSYAADQFEWDPVITKTASYDAYAGYSSSQGPVWYYQQRPKSGGAATNMTWSATGGVEGIYFTTDAGPTGWLGDNGSPLIATGHPGNSIDVIRKWVAPAAGVVSITGKVYKVDTGGGDGVTASVEYQGSVLWSKAVAYNDAVGYSTDSSLGSVSVNSGDSICFIVDPNGDNGYDQFGWDPVVNFVGGSSIASWTLNTSDTLLTLMIIGNQSAITNLEDAQTLYNWTPSPTAVPLLNTVYEGSTQYNPNWSYTSAAVDTSSGGKKVTLTFTSTNPSLTLTQCWWAHPGVGPVEEATSITNNTGTTVTYQDIDVVAADLTVTADNTVTLWRFNRSSLSPGQGKPHSTDSGFATGVFKNTINANASIGTTISNDPGFYGTENAFDGFLLPFIMLDVGATHGLYIGYTRDFGNITTTTCTNALQIRNLFQLWNSGTFVSQTSGSTQTIAFPGMFFGTYKGDTDCGSNKMKGWFWNNKITPTLKNHTNEPLVEYGIGGDTESEANGINYALLLSWGAELLKEDHSWADDGNDLSSPPTILGWDWNPNATAWPNGMNLGTIVHSHNNLQLSLYMANQYNLYNLGTSSGVSSEETALENRFNGNQTINGYFWAPGGYDYWRTDIDYETTTDYLSHLGFMQVLDYMISNHSGFRWENCSSGGSKKSFDLLQRQTFMTTDDDGNDLSTVEDYRQAYYANSYMINPVQMKADNVLFWADHPDTLEFYRYEMRIGLLGSWLFGDVDPIRGILEPTQYQSHVSLYKSQQRPILRGADVYHILPICDGTNWDGIEFLNTALTTNPRGSVFLFKPNSSTTSKTFCLKGLIPTTTYTLTYQDRTSSNTRMSGNALMAAGALTISGTANDYDSEIIWLSW